jgi:hypothetical protein
MWTIRTSTPSVLGAARTSVGSAVRIAKEIAIGWSAHAIRRVLGTNLSLFREANVRSGPGGDLGEVTLEIGNTGIAVAVLATQALVGQGRVGLAGWLDPFEVDVGSRETGESADSEECCLHRD